MEVYADILETMGHTPLVRLPPVGIPVQYRAATDIPAVALRIHDHFSQRGNITQPEVKALPGDRVQGVYGITYQRHARSHGFPGT